MNILRKKIMSSDGKEITVTVDYEPCKFTTTIIVDNVIVSRNDSFTNQLRAAEHLVCEQQNMEDIANSIIEFSSELNRKLKTNGTGTAA